MPISEQVFLSAQQLRDAAIAQGHEISVPYDSFLAAGLSELTTSYMDGNDVIFAFESDDPEVASWSVRLTNKPWIIANLSSVSALDAYGKPLFRAVAEVEGAYYACDVTLMAWVNLSQQSLWDSLEWRRINV